MSFSSMLACLAAIVQFQACDRPPAQGAAVAKADRLDMEIAEMQVRPAGSDGAAALWRGFYLGGSVGYGIVSSSQQLNRGNNHGYAEIDPGGFVGSLTAGYNFVPGAGSLLFGLEADVGVMAIAGDDEPVFDGHSWKPSYGPLWGGMRARAGWLVGDTLLLYATGGLAFMQTDSWTLGNNFNESSWDAKLRTGWVLGVGVEYALSERWKAKAEFLYMDFGSHSGYTEDNDPYTFEDSATIFRLGVNYQF